jgi:hypothetical protein
VLDAGSHGRTRPTCCSKREPAGAAAAVTKVRSDRRQSEFEQLPGIGPVTAQVIGAFRFERGTFSSVDQLLHLRRAEDRRGELVPPVPGHEHAARVVDPQLSTGRLIVLNFDGTSGLTCRFARWDDCRC